MTSQLTARYDNAGNQLSISDPIPTPFPPPYVLAQGAVAAPLTGTMVKTALASVTIPGNSIGPNGSVRISVFWVFTNSANIKTLSHEFGGNVLLATFPTTTASVRDQRQVYNQGTGMQNVQAGTSGGFGGTAVVDTQLNVDTTKDVLVQIFGQLANAADSIRLAGYTIEILPGF